MRRWFAVLLSVLLLSPISYGWNGFGHMAVAYVAYQHLDAPTQARADQLIRLNPLYATWKKQLPSGLSASQQNAMLFMIAATWPDQIRSDHSYHSDGPENGDRPPATGGDVNIGYSDKALHKYWHFVDNPFSQDGTAVDQAPSPSAGTQIKAFSKALGSDEPDSLKSYDLVWLMHMVGDIHEPLHNASRFSQEFPQGDAGGNFVLITQPPCKGDPSAEELHAVWDGAIGASSDPQAVIAVATVLPAQTVDASDQDVDAWAAESMSLALTKAYVAPIGDGKGPFTIDQAYCAQVYDVAAQRVVQAGMRLANLVNANLK
ncbi:MAG TPA: S1/P1 nuclease [Candidatus Angelobacter sp.]|nr:S1/P1 nuclease [Candidatus Angelobacter sp.]